MILRIWLIVKSTTRRRIPPPGPNLVAFGMNPLNNALTPSSLATSNRDGYVQLYLGTTPGTLTVPCIRLLTTSKGVLRIVPQSPPIVPAVKLLKRLPEFDSAFGSKERTWKMTPKYPPSAECVVSESVLQNTQTHSTRSVSRM